MPKVKEKHKYVKEYSEDDVQRALLAVSNGLSQRKAAMQFAVPRATIQFRLSNAFTGKTTCEPPPVLGKAGEDALVQWISKCVGKGFPKRKEDVQASVKNYLDSSQIGNPFKNCLPGDGWYQAFLKRNPSITERVPEGVTNASSNVNEGNIRKWFNKVHDALEEEGLLEILSDPERIWIQEENFIRKRSNKENLSVKRNGKDKKQENKDEQQESDKEVPSTNQNTVRGKSSKTKVKANVKCSDKIVPKKKKL